jgi:Rieske Fe-S protein
MAKCEVCGNDDSLSFEVIAAGSFERAIHELVPVCAHCGCRVLGYGVEANGTFYCCAHCARSGGATDVAGHSATSPRGMEATQD